MISLISEIKFAILFLVLMSALSVLTLFDNDSEKISLKNSESPSVGTVLSVDELLQRTPASVLTESDPNISAQFFCKTGNELKAPAAQKVKKNMVMLNFKVCMDEKLIASVSLLNQTNGFRAQIFKHEFGQYKTDYIQLSEGSNNVQAEIILKDGQKTVDSLVILTGS